MSDLNYANLDRFNVIVLPAVWGNLDQILGKQGGDKLGRWVSGGGTLICVGRSAAWAADSINGLSQVRLKRQVLDELAKYDLAIEREIQAEAPEVDTMALYHPELVESNAEGEDSEKPAMGGPKGDKDEDAWQRRFHPAGVIVRAGIDTEHWLAFGMRDKVPVFAWTRDAFMSKPPVKTVARYADDIKLRLSGLFWPEGRERWAQTACVTRENRGRGQIIMFADEPAFRATWFGPRKMFLNAVLYGPGFTRQDSPYGRSSSGL